MNPRSIMDIHTYFGLSYANYLVLPRSVLQSMPEEWQHQFAGLLNRLGDTMWEAGVNWEPREGYLVQRVSGRTVSHYPDCDTCSPSIACAEHTEVEDDPYADYQRGRRNVFRE